MNSTICGKFPALLHESLEKKTSSLGKWVKIYMSVSVGAIKLQTIIKWGKNRNSSTSIISSIFEAKHFYDTIQDNCETYANASMKLILEYSSTAGRNRVTQHLQTSRLNDIMEKETCEISKWIEKHRSSMITFGPQGPYSYSNEKAKVE